MKTKKIPISFNPEDQLQIKELIDLMGIVGVYGDIPKAVKFSITLALSAIKNPQKVYHYLNDDEMDVFFKSVAKAETIQRYMLKAENMQEMAKKV